MYIYWNYFLRPTDEITNDSNETMLTYVQDPCANIKTGFGYSVSTKQNNGGSIHFVKGETMNLQNNQIPDKNNVIKQHKDTTKNCDTNEGNVKFNLFVFSSVKLFYF